jgi:hypothetical protein
MLLERVREDPDHYSMFPLSPQTVTASWLRLRMNQCYALSSPVVSRPAMTATNYSLHNWVQPATEKKDCKLRISFHLGQRSGRFRMSAKPDQVHAICKYSQFQTQSQKPTCRVRNIDRARRNAIGSAKPLITSCESELSGYLICRGCRVVLAELG